MSEIAFEIALISNEATKQISVIELFETQKFFQKFLKTMF